MDGEGIYEFVAEDDAVLLGDFCGGGVEGDFLLMAGEGFGLDFSDGV